YTFRLLLDRSLSDLDIKFLDYNFYDLSVDIKFDEITEDCIKTKFKASINKAYTISLEIKV
ncbi:TPA: hypothetical protein ACG3IT_003579, partial [Clostridioides difficile]